MPIHVTPKGGKWQVIKGGASKASRVVDTKAEAEAIAKTQAKNQGAKVRLHKKDGTIQAKPQSAKKTATKKTTAKKAVKK